MLNESQLIERLTRQEEAAFRELIHRYQTNVYQTVISFLRSSAHADDVTQEVFIEVYESIHGFRQQSSLSTWLYRIAVTKSLEHLRKNKARKRWGFLYSLWDDDGTLRFDAPGYDHPGVSLENKERAEALFRAVEQLPELQQTAYTLAKIKGLSQQEVAEVMGTSSAAVESSLHRATQNLRKQLTHYYNQLDA